MSFAVADGGRVVDGADPYLDAAACAVVGVAVRDDVLAACPGLLDGGRQFGVGELRHPDRVRGRSDAAGNEHLDVVGALPQLLARDAAHLVHPVDHLADHA